MNKKEMKQNAKIMYSKDMAKFNEENSDVKQPKKFISKFKYKLSLKKASKNRKKVTSDKTERKQEKYYKKLVTKNRRITVLSLVLLFIIYIGVSISPYISDINRLMGLDIDTTTSEAVAAREYGQEVALNVSDEGLVLLKNDDNTLPLTEGNRNVNVFGFSASNFRYGGSGSGATDESEAVDFYQGLENAGISYNEDLYNYYTENEDMVTQPADNFFMEIARLASGEETVYEPSIDYLTEEMIADAQAYSDTAIIVIGSQSTESMDAEIDQLQVSQNMLDLIDVVANSFEDVILIINAGNAIELSFVEDYPSIKSVLWVGTPGAQGNISIGNTLAGNTNPSGRLPDTYVYDSSSHPSSENFGDYQLENVEGIGRLDYEEGIYVGYRYYETRYENDEEAYDQVVQYPFGYGLSYTTFEQTIVSSSVDGETVKMDINVTNTGSMAGKDVVQVYFQAPYIEGGIEKSAIELAAFDKTQMLEPGESELIQIEFPVRDMSSYDMVNEEAYVLDAGTYTISLRNNVHDEIDSFDYVVDETVVYKTDEVTGAVIENQFDYADGDLTYMSRSDFEGTYPSGDDVDLTLDQELVDMFYDRPEPTVGEEYTMGADNGIMLIDLKGKEFDDPMWDLYLDQFTFDQLNALFNQGAYKTTEIPELGIPETYLLDGPSGLNYLFGSNMQAASYPSELLISSTWNTDLAYDVGDAIGMEANAYGVEGWYAPAMNIHRSPMGGRNFEYFSEDPLISGMMGANMIMGAQDHDVITFMKHFVLNEQEVNARSGVMVFTNEQALRELYLRPFEISVKEGGANGAMSSFIHVGPVWSGGNEDLLVDVLRTEWGFDGIVSTDAVLGSFMDPNLALRSGNELMLAVLPTNNMKKLEDLYEEDPVGIVGGLRDRVHQLLYTILNETNAVDEYAETN